LLEDKYDCLKHSKYPKLKEEKVILLLKTFKSEALKEIHNIEKVTE
jgi:hypothetical protein